MSQEVLDASFAEGKAELEGDRLTIQSRGAQTYKLIPAFKFLYLAEGDEAGDRMVGKIFTRSELEKAGADIYMDSVLLGERAYQVEQGFVGIPLEAPKAEQQAAPRQEPRKEQKQEQPKEPQQGEAVDDNMLSDYLLKIL